MKIRFVLKGISGRKLFSRFSEAIKESGVGWDEKGGHATLSRDGGTWITQGARFEYHIMNPKDDESAVVLYDGRWNEFLAQNLLPAELKGKTTFAEVVKGNALIRHGVEKLGHISASVLMEAYGLMHAASSKNKNAFNLCVAAVEAVRILNVYLRTTEAARSGTFIRAGPNSGGYENVGVPFGDPAVFITLQFGGKEITHEIQLRQTGKLSTVEGIVEQVVGKVEHPSIKPTPSERRSMSGK